MSDKETITRITNAQGLRMVAVKLDTVGNVEVMNNVKLYQNSYGFVGLRCLVPITVNNLGEGKVGLCTVQKCTCDVTGKYTEKVFGYALLYVGNVRIDGVDYMAFEAPMPQEFTETVGELTISFVYSNVDSSNGFDETITTTTSKDALCSKHIKLIVDSSSQKMEKVIVEDASGKIICRLSEIVTEVEEIREVVEDVKMKFDADGATVAGNASKIIENEVHILQNEKNIQENAKQIGYLQAIVPHGSQYVKTTVTQTFDDRITADGQNIINESYATIKRIDGVTAKNLCPMVRPMYSETNPSSLMAPVRVETSNGSYEGQYLQAKETENGLEISLVDDLIAGGDSVIAVQLMGWFNANTLANITLDAGKTYHLSSGTNIGDFAISWENEDGTYGSCSSENTISGVSALNMASISIDVNSGTTLPITEKSPWIIAPMLNEGEERIPYIPYGSTRNSIIKSIKSKGNNLVDISKAVNPDNLIYEGDGVYRYIRNISEAGEDIKYPVYLDEYLPAGEYTFACTYMDTDSNETKPLRIYVPEAGMTDGIKIETGANDWDAMAPFGRWMLFMTSGTYVRFKDFRLFRGDDTVVLPYIPYDTIDTLTISEEGIELKEGDYIDFENGKVVKDGTGENFECENTYKVWNKGTEIVEGNEIPVTITTEYFGKVGG